MAVSLLVLMLTDFGVTLTGQAGIKSYETVPADLFAGIGGGYAWYK